MCRVSQETYLEAVETVLRQAGCTLWPSELVSRWQSFVDECEQGYSWDLSEYDNEIRARRDLHLVLEATVLQGFAELKELAEVVEPLDQRFRALLQEGVDRPKRTTWFERGVLRRAGEPYAEYFRSAHGIHVEVSE